MIALLLLLLALPLGRVTPVSVLRQGLNMQRAEIVRPSVTAGDGAFLVTWADYRTEVPAPLYQVGQTTGTAIRVGLDGRPLDQASFELPVVPDGVVWNGEHWIVINRRGYVRVSGDGVILDKTMRAFATPIPTRDPVLAVWTGRFVLVVARDPGPSTPENGRLLALTYDAAMRPLQQVVLLPKTFAGGDPLAIATDGRSAMVLYRQVYTSGTSGPFELRSALFDERGLLISNAPIYSQTIKSHVALGAGDDGYAFVTRTTSPRGELYEAVFVGTDNQVTGKTAPFGAGTSRFDNGVSRTLTWDGAAFTFFHSMRSTTGSTDLFVTRIPTDGQPVGTPMNVLPWDYRTDGNAIVPVARERGVTLVLEAERIPTTGGERLVARAVAEPATLGSAAATNLNVGAYPQETPAAASSATQTLVAWRERTRFADTFDPAFSVYATRVTDGGSITDPQSIEVSTSSCAETQPVVVSDGRNFIVAWADGTSIRTRQVRANGNLGSIRSIATFEDCYGKFLKLAGASNGLDALIVWTDRPVPTQQRVLAVRVDGEGRALDATPIVIGTTLDLDSVPSVASDGRDYVVAFGNEIVGMSGSGALLNRFVALDGEARVEGLLWNGQTYAAWVRHATGPYRLYRVARNGSNPSSEEPAVANVPAAPYAAKRFSCRQGVCLAPHGAQVLSVKPDLGIELLDVDAPPGRLTTVVAGAARPFLVYVTRPAERPFGGISRVFVQGAPSTRSRAVRHP